MENNPSNEIRVLTAGGAANPGRKGKGKASQRRKNKKKYNNNNNTTTPENDLNQDDDNKKSISSYDDAFQTAEFIPANDTKLNLEYEESFSELGGDGLIDETNAGGGMLAAIGDGVAGTPTKNSGNDDGGYPENELVTPVNIEDLYKEESKSSQTSDLIWLFLCFIGIMASFVCYGLLLEYTTSGGRKLHELSFLFVTSGLYTLTAAAGRYVRGETLTTIPPSRFAILGLTSMGSTFTSVRSLRYVIYPIQVLAKSCKPVPVMLMGTLMGKRYDFRKYINVVLIVFGVALFMGGGKESKGKGGGVGGDDEEKSSGSQFLGIILLFISLCFDGGTGAYEDKLMSVHSVQPFDLMYNIQLGKTILAGVSLLVSLLISCIDFLKYGKIVVVTLVDLDFILWEVLAGVLFMIGTLFFLLHLIVESKLTSYSDYLLNMSFYSIRNTFIGSKPAPYFHSNVSRDGSFIGRSWIKWCNGTGKGSSNHSSNSIYFDSIFLLFFVLV